MTYLNIIFFLLISSTTYAAGGAGTASITDLLYPAINFGIVFGLIGLKLRKPISAFFTKKAEEVESLYNLAEKKYKEAQIKYDANSKKLEQLDSEITRIGREADEDLEAFIQLTKKETNSTFVRLEKDASNKLEAEKKQMVIALSKKLVDQVINKTKDAISSNKGHQSRATEKLVTTIQ